MEMENRVVTLTADHCCLKASSWGQFRRKVFSMCRQSHDSMSIVPVLRKWRSQEQTG
ncbi:mCG147662 [Mus musculus]|nr:mCG147662 [Mus musculus]